MADRVLIIGAGAAGLIAAGTASGMGKDVTILERNERPARKVVITGKGRCNVTNDCDVREVLKNFVTLFQIYQFHWKNSHPFVVKCKKLNN